MTIGIFYLSVGSGHKMAAQAVNDVLTMPKKTSVFLKDPMMDLIPKFNIIASKAQSIINNWGGNYYDHQWRSGKNWMVRAASRSKILLDHFEKLLNKNEIDAVVCTHVFPLLVTLNLNILRNRHYMIFGVVTDYGLHGLWPSVGINGLFLPTITLLDEMKARGSDENKLFVTGIPIRADFNDPLLKDQGSERDPKLRLLFIGGGENNGAYMNASECFLKNLIKKLSVKNNNFVVDVVTGNNFQLYKRVDELRKEYTRFINLHGYVTGIARLMKNSDFLISKPGGLVVSEALACQLPIIILPHGPGQERANANFLIKEGMGVRGDSVGDVVRFLCECQDAPQKTIIMKNNMLKYQRPNAAIDISNVIMNGLQTFS